MGISGGLRGESLMQMDLLSSCAVARHSDPSSSHEAAEKVSANGTRASQQLACLEAVRNYPGHTSAELAVKLSIDRYVTGRRLPELREAGLLRNGPKRECTAKGSQAITWYVI